MGELLAPRGTSPTKRVARAAALRPPPPRACTHCGLCVRQCPMQAIGEDCAAIDGEKCIACFRCVKKLPCPGEGRVHPRVPELCRGFLRKAERPQGEPVFSGQGLNFPGGAGGKRGILPPRAAGLFPKLQQPHHAPALGTNHIKSKRAVAREQQLFFTLENLPHRTWRRRISLTPST